MNDQRRALSPTSNLAPLTDGRSARRQAEASAIALETFSAAGFVLLFQVIAAAKVKQGVAVEQVILATTIPAKADDAFQHFKKQGEARRSLYAYVRIDVYDPREASGWRALELHEIP